MGDKRYFYITPEDFKIAEENGISKDTLLSRVRKLGWDVDKAITTPVRPKRKFTKEEIKIMEENGVERYIAAGRMYWGWTLEEAITKPKKKVDNTYIQNGYIEKRIKMVLVIQH